MKRPGGNAGCYEDWGVGAGRLGLAGHPGGTRWPEPRTQAALCPPSVHCHSQLGIEQVQALGRAVISISFLLHSLSEKDKLLLNKELLLR